MNVYFDFIIPSFGHHVTICCFASNVRMSVNYEWEATERKWSYHVLSYSPGIWKE
jgi:hypothetical protein